MKIVFVNPVGAVGGAERAMLTFMKALIERKQSPVELYLIVGTEGPLIEQAQQLGVEVTTLKLPEEFNELGDSVFKHRNRVVSILLLLSRSLKTLPSLINYGKEFKQTLKEIQPDLIHSNGIKTHLLTIFAKPQKVPLIWHIHDFYGSRPLMAKILEWSSVHAQCGIAISQAVAEDARITLPKLSTVVMYNAIDIDFFSPQDLPSHLSLIHI